MQIWRKHQDLYICRVSFNISLKANDLTTLHPSDHPNAYLPNFHVESAIWRFDRIRVLPQIIHVTMLYDMFFSITNHQFWSTSILRNFHIYIYIWFVLYTLRSYGRWAMASGFSLVRRGRAVSNGCAHARCSSWRSIACGRCWAAIDGKQGGISPNVGATNWSIQNDGIMWIERDRIE